MSGGQPTVGGANCSRNYFVRSAAGVDRSEIEVGLASLLSEPESRDAKGCSVNLDLSQGDVMGRTKSQSIGRKQSFSRFCIWTIVDQLI